MNITSQQYFEENKYIYLENAHFEGINITTLKNQVFAKNFYQNFAFNMSFSLTHF